MTNAETFLPPGIKIARPPQFVRQAVSKFKFPLFLLLIHLPLGIVFYSFRSASVIHPYLVFLLGLYLAMQKQASLEKVAYLLAYIVGCEVLWRMSEIPIFWETGKYATMTVMLVALIRRGCRKIPPLPMIYLAVLLPGCLLTFFQQDWEYAKGVLSFNISGPALLAVACWFFSYWKPDENQLKKLFLCAIIPLTTIAFTTLFFTVTSNDLVFGTESNHGTSGGFGPNQVSAMLGFGAFLAITWLLVFKNDFKLKLYLIALALFLVAQSMMTFSRGGMYNAIGGIAVVMLFQMRNLRKAIGGLAFIVILGSIFVFLIFPYLNQFTGGMLLNRFEQIDTTNRGEIIESDFHAFLENPLTGVGVGLSQEYRIKYLNLEAASHTEFARLLSEHGIFGILAMCALLFMGAVSLKKHRSPPAKALAAGCLVWCVLFMLNAGMRVAAPSFIWGLTFITLVAPRRAIRSLPEKRAVRIKNEPANERS